MIKVKTSELIGAALDWAVGICEHGADRVWWNLNTHGTTLRGAWMCGNERNSEYERVPNYSTDWAQGGPIIEREFIELTTTNMSNNELWEALGRGFGEDCPTGYGPTPLIAAMRCLVANKLGDIVEIPKELMPC